MSIPFNMKMRAEGIVRGKSIKFGFTDFERENILSFHFIGTVKSSTEADGTFVIFQNGKIATKGKWALKPGPEVP